MALEDPEAIATYDEVVARFGTAAEPALMEEVARALANKGDTLAREGKSGGNPSL